MLRRTQPVRRNQNHQFRIRQTIASPAKRIPNPRKLRESRQPSNRARLLAICQSPDQTWLILSHPHRLRQGAVRNNGNPIYISPRQRPNFKFQLQRNFAIRMQRRRGLHLQTDIHVFRAWIWSLSRTAPRCRQRGRILNNGHHSLTGRRSLRHQRHVRKSAAGKLRYDQRTGTRGRVQFHSGLKCSSAKPQKNAQRALPLVSHCNIG